MVVATCCDRHHLPAFAAVGMVLNTFFTFWRQKVALRVFETRFLDGFGESLGEERCREVGKIVDSHV